MKPDITAWIRPIASGYSVQFEKPTGPNTTDTWFAQCPTLQKALDRVNRELSLPKRRGRR